MQMTFEKYTTSIMRNVDLLKHSRSLLFNKYEALKIIICTNPRLSFSYYSPKDSNWNVKINKIYANHLWDIKQREVLPKHIKKAAKEQNNKEQKSKKEQKTLHPKWKPI